MVKRIDSIDVHVGARIRAARIQAGLSQTHIANALGITFQQIQKYEKGANRISPSRLMMLAHRLGMPVSVFFETADSSEPLGPGDPMVQVSNFVNTREGVELNRAFAKLPTATSRRNVIQLVRAAAGQDKDQTG